MNGFLVLPASLRAGIWMTGAMLSFTLMAISGRSLADKLDTFEIMTYRSLIGIVIVLAVAYPSPSFASSHAQPRGVRH